MIRVSNALNAKSNGINLAVRRIRNASTEYLSYTFRFHYLSLDLVEVWYTPLAGRS